ncbi:MAG: hypothetical protein J7494_02685 [Sphingobium sp.]|nr:hypothetical protein [Sphingobium sp.]
MPPLIRPMVLVLAHISAVSLWPASASAKKPTNTLVVVADCYPEDAHLSIAIDGKPLRLTPPAQRDGSVALCFGKELPIGRRVQVRLHSDRFSWSATFRREEGKALLIAAGASHEQSGFVDKGKLLFD